TPLGGIPWVPHKFGGAVNVKVIKPVGLLAPDRVAVSFRGKPLPSCTVPVLSCVTSCSKSSDRGVRVSISVAELLPGLVSIAPDGAVTLAVLARVPVAVGSMLAEKVKATLAPTGRSTLVLREPVPLPALPALIEAPPLALTNPQVSVVTPEGPRSVT